MVLAVHALLRLSSVHAEVAMEAGSTMRSVRYAVAAECSPAAPLLRETGAAQSPKPKLLDRVRHAIRARHYSRRTEKAHVHLIKLYIFLLPPRRISPSTPCASSIARSF